MNPECDIQYKYIRFVRIAEKPKTSVWSCRDLNNIELGQVKWYAPWRQYCYVATSKSSEVTPSQAVYTDVCLRDIDSFIQLVKNARKVLQLAAELKGGVAQKKRSPARIGLNMRL